MRRPPENTLLQERGLLSAPQWPNGDTGNSGCYPAHQPRNETAMNSSAPTLFRLPKNASDRQKRIWEEDRRRWLSDRIAQQVDVMTPAAAAVAHMTLGNWREWNEKYRIQQARSGNPEPLRRLYPQFSDCIHSPPLKQGCKYPPPPKFDTAKGAADFARRIPALWRKQYGRMPRAESEKK